MNKALDVAQAFVGDTPTSIYVFTDTLDKKQLPMDKDSVKWLVRGATKDLTNIAITRFLCYDRWASYAGTCTTP